LFSGTPGTILTADFRNGRTIGGEKTRKNGDFTGFPGAGDQDLSGSLRLFPRVRSCGCSAVGREDTKRAAKSGHINRSDIGRWWYAYRITRYSEEDGEAREALFLG
jgi:hypothetical protein